MLIRSKKGRIRYTLFLNIKSFRHDVDVSIKVIRRFRFDKDKNEKKVSFRNLTYTIEETFSIEYLGISIQSISLLAILIKIYF